MKSRQVFDLAESSNTVGFFNPVSKKGWYVLAKIPEANLRLNDEKLIKEYRDLEFIHKVKAIFREFLSLNKDEKEDLKPFINFYLDTLKAFNEGYSFDDFILNNQQLKFNSKCINHAITLRELAAYIFEQGSIVNQHSPIKGEGYHIYHAISAAINEVNVITQVTKDDLNRHNISLIHERNIIDLNLLYFSDEYKPKAAKLIQQWSALEKFDEIAKLSVAIRDKKWHEVNTILEQHNLESTIGPFSTG
ncbi:MAG: hypothetical protein H0U70_09285 [Tatlockia sp.]|nr:hypothetical protein [Tatlockia sp.]